MTPAALLRPQRDYRIDAGGPEGRNPRSGRGDRKQPHGHSPEYDGIDQPGLEEHLYQLARQQLAERKRSGDAEYNAQTGEEQPLAKHELEHAAGFGAQRQPDAQLAGLLRDRIGHDAIDPD